MFVEFIDANDSLVTLNPKAIWAVTTTRNNESEILLAGGEKAIKVSTKVSEDIRKFLLEA
jgi:hypothetical protein